MEDNPPANTITNTDTENTLREILKNESYKLNSKKGLEKLGPDIRAVKDNEVLRIEVIGYFDSSLKRAEDFYMAFFRAISRLNEKDCQYCIIAMPSIHKKFLSIKARFYRIAWRRIASAFPEL